MLNSLGGNPKSAMPFPRRYACPHSSKSVVGWQVPVHGADVPGGFIIIDGRFVEFEPNVGPSDFGRWSSYRLHREPTTECVTRFLFLECTSFQFKHIVLFYHPRAYGDLASAATEDKETRRSVVKLCFDFLTEFVYSKGKGNGSDNLDEPRVRKTRV